MVYKNKESKRNTYYHKKLIFSALIIIYIVGLCTGCSFTVKNAENLKFVQSITHIENIIKSENTGIFAQSAAFITRDIISIIIVIILKYSGILKGMCSLIPFIISVQNSCIYTILIYSKINYFKIIFQYILKNTAIALLILTYCYIIIMEILQQRNNPKKDIKRLMIYITGIICIYIIDAFVKTVIYPLQ